MINENRKYKKISSVTSDRIKRAAKILKKNTRRVDLGFKSFRLQKSNYKPWQNVEGDNIKKVELQFEEFTNPLIEGWKEDDLLTEVMLLEGFPLDSEIKQEPEFKKNKVQVVSSDFCEHRLHFCLDKKVYAETIKALQLSGEDIFICLDSAITDEQKVTLSDKGLIKTI